MRAAPYIFWGVVFVLTVKAASGCCRTVNYPYEQEAQAAQAYRVGPGDVLGVTVWGNKQLSGPVTVRPDGQVTLQLIGEVQASGRTPAEIQQDISRRLVRYVKNEPNVSVEVADVNSYRVYVVGRVNQPGEYSSDTPVDVLQAIALARGLTEFADPDNIVIMRRDDRGVRRIPFVYCQVVKHGRVDMNITLTSGDTVVVP